jgi:interferon gamma-inducible protein 30
VTEQCNKNVWKIQDGNDRVNLSIYYETLCPDCRKFITTQVWNAYQSILSIVNISFVPYGNAREVYRPRIDVYVFNCQHGFQECMGNFFHVNFEKKKNFIVCLFFFLLDLCDQFISQYNKSFSKKDALQFLE